MKARHSYKILWVESRIKIKGEYKVLPATIGKQVMVLPYAMVFARQKVNEIWKRLKVTRVSKTNAEAKINIT